MRTNQYSRTSRPAGARTPRYADLWSFQLLFLTIPFVLKTSWPHDFVFLPFTQAFLAWRLLEGEKAESGTDAAGESSHPGARRERAPRGRPSGSTVLLLVSIVLSNIVFFNVFGNFPGYGFLGFLFWADLLLLAAFYAILLPPGLQWLREKIRKNGVSS